MVDVDRFAIACVELQTDLYVLHFAARDCPLNHLPSHRSYQILDAPVWRSYTSILVPHILFKSNSVSRDLYRGNISARELSPRERKSYGKHKK